MPSLLHRVPTDALIIITQTIKDVAINEQRKERRGGKEGD